MNLPYRKRSVFYFSCLSVTIFEEGFCRMYVTICGRFRLDEGAVTGYDSRIRVKYTTKLGVQIVNYPKKENATTSGSILPAFIHSSIYFAWIYPCAFNVSAQRTAPPAAPLTVLWESPMNFQS